ncbi:MAG: TatD family hydrolase [Candidatus Pacebacteria bacterium]|nr:TatD family hydrolase [Candidatus Paceibacterota bacterium]
MDIRYIDTHSHLNLYKFADDRDEVFKKCADEDVGMITVGTGRKDSKLAVELAHKYEHAWAIVGLHPINVEVSDNKAREGQELEAGFDYDFYKELAEDSRAVGIGECGFDYFHNNDDTYEQQREVFVAQVALANEVGKPLMLHLRNSKDGQGRNAYDDASEILKTEAKVLGNAHFYAGTQEQAKSFFDIGYTISFTGVITFAQAAYQELVEYAPLDMIHGETDCPFVAPAPYRGKRAEPWMVKQVYKTIASMKNIDEEEVREQLLKNAANLYKI